MVPKKFVTLITKESCFNAMFNLIKRKELDESFELNESNYKKIIAEVGCKAENPVNMKTFKNKFIKNKVSEIQQSSSRYMDQRQKSYSKFHHWNAQDPCV